MPMQTTPTAAPPTASSTLLPLPDWIQRARASLSREEYLECAVSVALDLTERLRLVAGRADNSENDDDGFGASLSALNASASSWNDSGNIAEKRYLEDFSPSSLLVQIEDVATENVVVSLANHSDTSCVKYFAATEVNIRPTSEPGNIFEAPQPSQRSLCFALGKILFEVFSQGDPLFLVDLPSVIENFEDSFDDLLGCVGLAEEDCISPAPKRSMFWSDAAGPATSTPNAAKAKASLEERGMPLSVCRLVSDLLEAEEGKGNAYLSETALVSLEEARIDLSRMKSDPRRFLYDHTSSTEAWQSTSLFDRENRELYGREKELGTLMDAAARVSSQFLSMHGDANGGKNVGVLQMEGFACEAVFLSGHSGAGKSSIIKKLVSFCKDNHWFVLSCKFDRQIAPLSSLLQSIDAFFGYFVKNLGLGDASVQESFMRISRSIVSSINTDCLSQLCQLLPNLKKLFPTASYGVEMEDGTSGDFFAKFTDTVGSGSNRLRHLFQLVYRAICSGGCPVVIVLDDLQWSDPFLMNVVVDLINSVGSGSAFSAEESPRGGLLLLGSYRDNEVEEDGFLMKQIGLLERSGGRSNVTRLFVGELPEEEINNMLSVKLCLPMRYTRMLAQLVHQKTRGNPMYTIEFLRAILKQNVLTWSAKSRQFTWDETCVDMQTMSEGVVELLTMKLRQLPHDVVEALKVASCFGQINLSTIELLDLGWFVPNLQESLEAAVKEGILEKAGPLYAFSHDILQESTYQLVPPDEREALHRKIGKSLVQDPSVAHNPELCALAVDQVNLCKLDDPIERALFSRLNLAAGKHCVVSSSYEQARSYFEAGISLLHANPWRRQHALCLELYEMAVVVGYMDGKVEAVMGRLDAIIANASFDDALNSQALRAKLLASQNQFAEAADGVLAILSCFGEEFPRGASLEYVLNEVDAAMPMLKDVTKEKIVGLRPMTDKTKLNTMKFMDLLIGLSFYHDALLAPLVAIRMMKYSIEEGYCNDTTIPALAHASHAVLHYSNDIELAGRFGRICENLITGNAQEHALRARLAQLHCCVKYFVEPFQAAADLAQSAYNSAWSAGDVDNAMLSLVIYSIAHLFAIPDLAGLHKKMVTYVHQMAKFKRFGTLISTMAFFNTVTALMGNEDSCGIDPSIGFRTHKELAQLAEHTKNVYLLHHVIVGQMYVHCYFREYSSAAIVAEKYGMKTQAKRVLDFYFVFYQGIAALCLARDTKQDKWRKIGEKCVKTMAQLLEYSTWNFENMLLLLKAELNYLNGRISMAKFSYEGAIASAYDHRFHHEEALSFELYGIFLVENKKVAEGLERLELAREKYKSWGAAKKANDVLKFMDMTKLTRTWRS